jgi:GT2 family glycosyltransferase
MRLSIVIPTYRRPDLLTRCLAALAAQDLPAGDYEVLVADDAASDTTRAQVERLGSPAVRYVAVTGRHGPAAARNAGWRAARGDVIAFTDDDTVPAPGWASAGLGAFDRDPELAAAAGRTDVPLPAAPTDYERNESGLATAEFITANCFVRRSVLEDVGGFDERFRTAWREDSDLQFNLLERGLKLVKVPDAAIVHPVRPAKWGVSLRQQRKTQYDALLYKKHPELYRKRIRARPPWNYYAIVGCFTVATVAGAVEAVPVALAGGVAWLGLTARFAARRLAGNSRAARHVAEMAVTSAAIPFLSLFWRLYGAVKFHAWYF